MKLALTLPIPPSTNRLTRMRVSGGRAWLHKSTEARSYHDIVYDAAQDEMARTGFVPLAGERYKMTVIFYPDPPKDWGKRKKKSGDWDAEIARLDLDNVMKALGDAIQESGAIGYPPSEYKKLSKEAQQRVKKANDRMMFWSEQLVAEPDGNGGRIVAILERAPKKDTQARIAEILS